MKIFHVFLTSLVLVFCGVGTLYAASSDFTVRTLIGADTTPPSVPANLVATPVAISQIDLSWSTSTDNVAVAGYQVFRSSPPTTSFSHIATTTSPNYSDTGLSASTTYAYYVTAFDASDNISASSTVVSTTTLAPPPISPPTSGGDGSAPRIEMEPIPIELERLEIIPGTTSVTFLYETKGYVRSIIRWGETVSYEVGSLQERAFTKEHVTVVHGLQSGTRYVFAIEGENHLGRFGVLTAGSFSTLSPKDTAPPANVTGLRGTVENGTDIALSWNNPHDTDFSHVRVLRSDRFYPTDTADGWLVYEGSEERVLDDGAVVEKTTQYYTVFAYDEDGNVSSGAVLAVAPDGTIPVADIPEPKPTDGPPEERPEPLAFSFSDLVFTQNGNELTHGEDMVAVDGSRKLTVSVPYAILPEHLKTIVIEVGRGTERDAFLLRIDEERQFYNTTLAPLGVADRFSVEVSVYDFETFRIATAAGDIVSTIAHMPRKQNDTDGSFLGYLGAFFDSNIWLFVSFSLLFLLLLILFLLTLRQLAHADD